MMIKYMYSRIIFLLVLFSSSVNLAQSVSIGAKLESIYYFYKNTINNSTDEWMLPIPISGYLKVSVLFNNKYEVELKGGAQLGEIFFGPEYALTIKYNLLGDIFPLLTYLNHHNSGDSRTGRGTYNIKIEFIGAGVEAKLTKIFGLDLIYYLPIGKKDLEYDLYSVPKTTSKMESMIKLGFIFNINL